MGLYKLDPQLEKASGFNPRNLESEKTGFSSLCFSLQRVPLHAAAREAQAAGKYGKQLAAESSDDDEVGFALFTTLFCSRNIKLMTPYAPRSNQSDAQECLLTPVW